MMETDFPEINEGTSYIGYQKAFELICSHIKPLGSEEMRLELCLNRIAAADAVAAVSYPPADVSLKDGFALKARDVIHASSERPVSLKVIGSAFAGLGFNGLVEPGTGVKVCSGAPIPSGADAVVPVEFCSDISDEEVLIRVDAGIGRNILREAEEVRAGGVVVEKGTAFSPGNMGLSAAAGIDTVRVSRHPKVAIVGVGDEVVAPGERLRPGQIYASNLVTLKSWLSSFDIKSITSVSKDNAASIKLELEKCRPEVDVILTSGGAWGSERDLVIGTLDSLNWHKIFHHVRMGPGKGVAFGLWENIPVFCLPPVTKWPFCSWPCRVFCECRETNTIHCSLFQPNSVRT